jgi:hypothetical protein
VGKGCNFIFNLWAWIWNHFWGTLFLIGGVYGLFSGYNFWACLLCIGVGIYFYMSQRQEEKVGEVASKAAKAAATVVVSEVNKERNAAIDLDASAEHVVETDAPVSDVTAALDAILGETWFDLYHGRGLKVAERTGDTTVYVFSKIKVPEAVKFEVRVSREGDSTRAVFRCLHQDGTGGLRPYAELVTRLRESMEYAVAAAGDAVKVAEGMKLYGPPEAGSPAAVKARNVKILLFVGVLICLVPLYKLSDGIPMGELPKWLALEALGAAVIWGTTRWAKGAWPPGLTRTAFVAEPSSGNTASPAPTTAHEALPLSAPAGEQAQEAAAEAAAAAGKAAKASVAAARAWFTSLTTNQRALVVIVAVVLVIGTGLTITGSWPGGGSDDYYEYSTEEITTNADPMTAAEARDVIRSIGTLDDLLGTYVGSGLSEFEVYYEGRVMDASDMIVFNDGEEAAWAVPYSAVQGGFYLDDVECSEQDFRDMAVSGNVMWGSIGYSGTELWYVNIYTE